MPTRRRACLFCEGFFIDDGIQEIGVHQTGCPELSVPRIPDEIAAMISELA